MKKKYTRKHPLTKSQYVLVLQFSEGFGELIADDFAGIIPWNVVYDADASPDLLSIWNSFCISIYKWIKLYK